MRATAEYYYVRFNLINPNPSDVCHIYEVNLV